MAPMAPPASPAGRLHVDTSEGHYVPNLTVADRIHGAPASEIYCEVSYRINPRRSAGYPWNLAGGLKQQPRALPLAESGQAVDAMAKSRMRSGLGYTQGFRAMASHGGDLPRHEVPDSLVVHDSTV